MKKKTLIAVLSAALICCLVVAGTLAYLSDVTNPIKNTFTIGKVEIELNEEGGTPDSSAPSSAPVNQFKLIPLEEITKDAKITVSEESEAAYLFAVLDEVCTCKKDSSNFYTFADYITYSVADGWTALDAVKYPGVYYRSYTEPAKKGEDTVYQVIKDGKVTVADLTDAQIEAAGVDGVEVSLTVQAGAVQSANVSGKDSAEKVANAWNAIKSKFAKFAD